MEQRNIKELIASYFFIFELLRFGETVRDFQPQQFLQPSISNISSGLKSVFVDAWSLKSSNSKTVSEYLKSSEFRERISYSFMYSLAVTIACLPILIPYLKKFFNVNFLFLFFYFLVLFYFYFYFIFIFILFLFYFYLFF